MQGTYPNLHAPDQELGALSKGLASQLRLSGNQRASLQSCLQYLVSDLLIVLVREVLPLGVFAAGFEASLVRYVKQDLSGQGHHYGRQDP
jgi:hypothetical protein